MRLQQVLLNLLGNANKFTHKGSIQLMVRLQDGRTTGDVQFAVTDTGIGIPQDKLQSIFEDFTQADDSTTRQYGGTGLGLGIVKRLVELMQGEIEVESQVGRGSVFRFTASFQPATLLESREESIQTTLTGKRILVIDDDEINRMILRETLEKEGFVLSEFSSVQAALQTFERETSLSNTFSLLMLDSRIAECDGFEAFTRLRALDPSVPAVMLTSDDRPGEATRCQELGICDYAVKPVQRSQLLQMVAKAIRSQTSPASESRALAEPKAGLRILIAEDCDDSRFLMEAYLAESSHRITFAENGQEAVGLYAQGEFDLILMDMQMPVMEGRAATHAIRTLEWQQGRTHVPILALTANALAIADKASEEAGCDGHLTKPISKQRLLAALDIYPPELQRMRSN